MAPIVPPGPTPRQPARVGTKTFLLLIACAWSIAACRSSRPDVDSGPAPVAVDPPARPAQQRPSDLIAFTQEIPGTSVSFDMVPIPGGVFTMGSPEGEPGRNDDEGPQHRVEVGPFWMGKHEVTWDEYELWAYSLDGGNDPEVDGVSRPTPPYQDMTFGMGHEGCPAICMTQLAAKTYCEWLSAKTGRLYRLPTEAEWEYACRAGTTTAYGFGDDAADLDAHGWHAGNSDEEYHPVGTRLPNPWGLHDMHGNVAEWVLDQHTTTFYAECLAQGVVRDPLAQPTTEYPRVVRGGSWDEPPQALRSAARRASEPAWKDQDPQIPKSIWYHTDAVFVGFRVVSPYPQRPPDKQQ